MGKLFALAIFYSIPSQSRCSPTPSLSFLSSSRHAPSCLWRPDRGTQAVLIGEDRWLCATEAAGVTAKPVWPVVVTKAYAAPNTHASTPNCTDPANMPKCPSTKAPRNACPILSFSLYLYALLFSSSLLLTSVFNPVLILLFASFFHPPYTPSLLRWPSADLTGVDYYLRAS